jgi:hypothetical protein
MSDGYDPDRIMLVLMNGSGRNYVLPRNVKWADLPMVDKPVFDYGICYVKRHFVTENGLIDTTNEQSTYDDLIKGRIPDDEGIRRSRRALHDALPTVDHVIVLADGCDDRLIWEAVSPVWCHRKASFRITLLTGKMWDVSKELSFGDVSRLEKKFRGHDRFVANYMFNMLTIGGRARYQAGREAGPPGLLWAEGRLYNEDYPQDQIDANSLVTPAALPLLDALAKAGAAVDFDLSDDYEQQNFPRTLSQAPFFAREGDCLFFDWAGTGKWPRLRVGSGRWEHGRFLYRQKDSGEQYRFVTGSFFWCGYAALFNGRTAITPYGLRYLELIGADMVDPDVMLRWRTEDGRIATEDDIPACDRWLHTKFRALKRRVSSLPASPFSEPDIPVSNPRNKLVIRGYKYDLRDVPEPRRAALIAFVERTAQSIPPGRRKIGTIRSPWQTSPDELPTGIWIGFPLETMKLTQDLEARFDENADMRFYDRELHQRLSWIPPELSSVPREGPRFITTYAGQEELPRKTLRHHIALDRDMPLGHLAYGKAVFIEDLDDWRYSGRLRALGLGMWAGFEEGVPKKRCGLWEFGLRGSKNQGLFLGRYVGLSGTSNIIGADGPYLSVPHLLDTNRLKPLDDHLIEDEEVSAMMAETENRLWCFQGRRRLTIRAVFYDPGASVLAIGRSGQTQNAPALPSTQTTAELRGIRTNL